MPDLSYDSVIDLCRALRTGEIGALELLEHRLARVEARNPAINAVVALDAERARARAREADEARVRGESWGPLHGLSMTIKDSLEVVGMPAACGAPEWADNRPERNAAAVQRVVDAGAIVFGKTNVPLYAGDLQSYNDVYGTTRNPWDPQRTPGGSSGGAAASVAAGFTPFEVGSDIGGSIRVPAHFCGLFGHKPSYGLVPQRGHLPPPPGNLTEPDLGVIGPLARSAEDLALAFALLAGAREEDAIGWRMALPPARHDSLAGYRVGILADHNVCPVSAAVGDLMHAAVEKLTRSEVEVREVPPPIDWEDAHDLYLQLLYAVLGGSFPEPVRAALSRMAEALDPGDRSHGASLARGVAASHRDWLVLHERRAVLQAKWRSIFEDIDVLLCPITPTAAFAHDHAPVNERTLEFDGERVAYLAQLFWTGIPMAAGMPATAVPIGRGSDGLPVGMQVVGPRLEDFTPLDFAARTTALWGGCEIPPGYGDG